MLWDIFCKVIDNHGDTGVCWRLAADLGSRGETVRLWMDDLAALSWMAPQGAPGVTVGRWTDDTTWPPPGDVLVEAFGCDPAPAFVAAFARRHRGAPAAARWINLEYLSAEPFVERAHGLPSPVSHGPGARAWSSISFTPVSPRAQVACCANPACLHVKPGLTVRPGPHATVSLLRDG
jgi:uncharacterized repeat protein (TIGR03837 family)